jgi:adenylosuccinate synthase
VGVLRSHAVRHGAGPLPTESATLRARVEEHNASNPWQGPVRYGWLDAVLTRYALERCGGVDVLALTHLDLIERLGSLPVVAAYGPCGDAQVSGWKAFWKAGREGRSLQAEVARSHGPGRAGDRLLAAQAALGAWLTAGVEPLPAHVEGADALVAWAERELELPVGLTSRGPTAEHVVLRDAFTGPA